MNGYIAGAIVLFGVSSLIVGAGVIATQRFRHTQGETPGALGPGSKDWLLPAMAVDALAVVLLVVGLNRG